MRQWNLLHQLVNHWQEEQEALKKQVLETRLYPPHEVLNFIAHKHFKIVDPSKPEELNGFLQYFKEVRKVLVLDVQPGSLILTALCSSLEILDSLWYDYCTGHLNDMAQKYLVTEDVLKEFNLTELKLTTTIQMVEYIAAQKFFLQGSGEHIQSVSESCFLPNK